MAGHSLRLLTAVLAVSSLAAQQKPGYTDTPKIPGQKWRVHDAERPRPRVVTPGAAVGAAPSDAIVLFDGKNLDSWTGRGGKAGWKLVDGAMEVNGTGAIRTKEKFGDCQLHIEWRTVPNAKGSSQGKSNSGVFLMERYEIQVLDSFENETYADGQASALYGQFPPAVNACRKPGEWQSYDILFTAPRFDDKGALQSPARVTVIHNGVVTHLNRELLGGTTHKKAPKYKAHPPKGPLQLQDHGNPVRFRNVWIRPLGGS